VPCAGGWCLRHAERGLVETLVEYAHPAAVEEQNLKRVATPSEEDEQRPAPRVVRVYLSARPHAARRLKFPMGSFCG
jgi:hypothetical protein